MASLLVSAIAPSGCQIGNYLEVSLPGGGSCFVISPVNGRQRFQMLLPRFDKRPETQSPLARLHREMDESSSDDSDLEGTKAFPPGLLLERIIGNEQRMPYLLDFLQEQGGHSCWLLLLVFACDQHRKPRKGRNGAVRLGLKAHERSVFATYVSADAPKPACACFPQEVVARLKARDTLRVTPELNALSELRVATLRELNRRWHTLFRSSEAYRALLRDAIHSRNTFMPSPSCTDALDERSSVRSRAECRRFIAMLRTFLLDSCRLECHAQIDAASALRVFRWWIRLAGRLQTLCDRFAPPGSLRGPFTTPPSTKATFPLAGQCTTGTWTAVRNLSGSDGTFNSGEHDDFTIHAHAELRSAARRLLVHPPTHASLTILDKMTLEKISALLRREQTAFDFDTAATRYSALFGECAMQLERWLDVHVFEPFHMSPMAGELAVAEIDGRNARIAKPHLEDLDLIYDAKSRRSASILKSGALLLHAQCSHPLKTFDQHLGCTLLMAQQEAKILVSEALGVAATEKEMSRKLNKELDIDRALSYCGSLDVAKVPMLLAALLLDHPVGVLGRGALQAAKSIAALGNAIFTVATDSATLSHCENFQICPTAPDECGVDLVVTRSHSLEYEGTVWRTVTSTEGIEIFVALVFQDSKLPPPPPKRRGI